jgi:hypothetical protein
LGQDAAEPMDVVDEAQAFVTAWRTAGRLVVVNSLAVGPQPNLGAG